MSGRVGVIGVCVAVWVVGAAKRLPPGGGGDEVSPAIDGVGASGAGEQAVVTNAVKAAPQDVQEEAAYELVNREHHRFDSGLAGVLPRAR